MFQLAFLSCSVASICCFTQSRHQPLSLCGQFVGCGVVMLVFWVIIVFGSLSLVVVLVSVCVLLVSVCILLLLVRFVFVLG